MLLVLKMVGLGVSYEDHHCRQPGDLTPEQQQRTVRRLPSPLAFVSFVLGTGNLLGGPFMEYKDYDDFINHRGVSGEREETSVSVESALSLCCLPFVPAFFFCAHACALLCRLPVKPCPALVQSGTELLVHAHLQPSSLTSAPSAGTLLLQVWSPAAAKKVPPVTRQALWYMAQSLAFISLHLVLVKSFSVNILTSRWFHEEASMGGRLFAMTMVAATTRFKYYFAWLMVESAATVSGFNFVGWNWMKPQW